MLGVFYVHLITKIDKNPERIPLKVFQCVKCILEAWNSLSNILLQFCVYNCRCKRKRRFSKELIYVTICFSLSFRFSMCDTATIIWTTEVSSATTVTICIQTNSSRIHIPLIIVIKILSWPFVNVKSLETFPWC